MNQFVAHLVQAHAVDELHYIVVQSIVFTDAENRDDVGVVQPRHRARLALKSL